jgi:hypothetical protein
LVLATIFYCLRFETSHFVASYDSQGHGGGIRPRPHTSVSVWWMNNNILEDDSSTLKMEAAGSSKTLISTYLQNYTVSQVGRP